MAILAGVGLFSPLTPAGAPPALAAEDPARVTLTAARLTPSSLTISGTVTNVGGAPLRDVTAYLWRSTERLHSVAAVTGALEATTTTPGRWQPVEDANTARLVTGEESLGAGESRSFTVSGTPAQLGLAGTDASHWVGVDLQGRAGDARTVTALTTERTLVTQPGTPVPVATVVEFAAVPRLVKGDLFVDDSLADDLASGRLGSLLTEASRSGSNWVIDAGLLAEVRDMADGYRVQGEAGSTEGTRAPDARAWLDRLAALDPARGTLGLVGTPDLAAAAGLGDTAILERSARATREVELAGASSAILLTRPDADALALVAPLGRSVFALEVGAPAVRVEVAGTDVWSLTRPAQPLSASPLLDDTALNRRGAEAALGRARGGIARLLRTSEDVTAAALPLPEGFRAATPAELAASATEWTPPARPDLPSAVTADTLPVLLRLGEQLDAYGAVAPTARVGEVADAQVARSASEWWTPESQQAWLAAIDRRLALPEGDIVSIDAINRFSMAGATSEFPVTVTNHLTDPATIRLVVVTDNPQRIRFLPPPEATIAPGASATIGLQAEAAGGGVVRASVHAETLTGHRLTPDTQIEVETTNFGVIGWVLVIASGLVLVVTTGLRIRQVRRQKKGADD